MFRFRSFAISSLLFAAACAVDTPTAPPSDPDPTNPTDPTNPADPGGDQPATPTDQTAVNLGMTVMAKDASGAPRLMRSLIPRAALAGGAPEQIARDHVAALAPLWGQKAPSMALVGNGTQRLRNGATVVKLAQQIDGIPVHGGELRVMMHPSGALAAVAGTLVGAVTKPRFASSPSQALDSALDHLYTTTRARPAITELAGSAAQAGWQPLAVAADPALQVTKVRARRELAKVGDVLVPAWALEVRGAAPPDAQGKTTLVPVWRSYLVSDVDHQILAEADLMQSDAYVYRAYAETTGNRRPIDGALESWAPHPAGFPNGFAPGFSKQNLVVMEAFNEPHDKWLADDATTTSGNNVDAFSDFDGSGTFDEGEIRPQVRAGRVLNYTYDPTIEPLSSDSQLHAGTVNSFFLTNWMHDWWYDSGFTEAAGNAQVDNYGRGGVPGDPLTLLAQFGAPFGERNNAFMGTPSDGDSPQMLMLLWNTGGVGPERDGDVDNTVVAHEWGHYLHHRLAECGAGPQCSGMSEGWGDFNALMLMLREGDNRDGSYAEGVFALNDGFPDNAYYGIRRFPYSIDRTKNALSLRHIADGVPLPTTTPGFPGGRNSEPHNTGEVWASLMWEAFNILIDAHDVPVARRRMSDYVVAGLLLTPPDATFTEARDAILAAASALDTDDMTLMAAAFAGRGAGTCAVVPGNSVATNVGVVESGTLAARLQVSGMTLVDDGVSCDHDGFLDPGESGTLHVSMVNAGIVDAEQVTITATTANTGVRLGAAIHLPSVSPFSTLDLAIPVTLLPTAPRNAPITITVRLAGDGTCNPGGVTAGLTLTTGIDELAAAAKIDTVEATQSPWTPTGVLAASLWSRTVDAAGNHSLLGKNAGQPSDTQLVSPALQVSPSDPFIVKISHAFALEGSAAAWFDGGVIELSTNGGASWADVATLGVNPGYTGTLALGGDNPLEGRPAFSGRSPGFPARNLLTLNFGTQLAGQSALLRFRIGTDTNTALSGWDIDNIDVSGITNTPFPAVVTEPSTCTARKAITEDSAIVGTHAAPSTSLAAFDAQVCIATDTL